MRMKKKVLLLIFLFAAKTAIWGQSEEATTKSGKKVILYANGTWTYAEGAKTENKTKPEEKKEEKKKEADKKPQPETPVMTGDCSDRFETIEDQRTGIRTTRTKNMIIVASEKDTKEIDITLQKGARGVIRISLRPVGAGECIAEGNKIDIEFSDGSKLELSNDETTNCRGEATVNLGGNYGRKKQLEEISTKKIKTMKVWTQLGSVQKEFSEENREQFYQAINCLIKA